MKFVLKIEMGNSAMSTRSQVIGKLKELARDLTKTYDASVVGASIRDINGNRVGSWEFVSDDDDKVKR